VAIPLVVVWSAAFYGYASLERYALAIRKTADGKAFTTIARGLRWLAWGLPISSIASNILSGIAHNHLSFGKFAVIISHYVTLIISIVAFTIINNGTTQLVAATQKRLSINTLRGVLIGYITLATAYCAGTISNVVHRHTNVYYLPVWLISFTIIAPYLYAWLMGLFASYEISFYRKQVSGVFYKRALNLISWGLGMAIISSIILQYISSSSNYLRRIDFNWRLLLAYFFLLAYAIGFILVALGANKLKKIEEI